MTQYEVTVSMSTATVAALVDSGYILHAFRAVQSADRAGRPLLWLCPDYSAQTQVVWSDSYEAYTSATPIRAGQRILAGFAAPIRTSEILKVRSGGTGEVTMGGSPGTISVLNTTATQFTCGIGGVVADYPAPFCAFPLYGNHLQRFVPLAKVLLTFSTLAIMPGTVIGGSYPASLISSGPGIFVDLTAANQRALCYDVNAGWSWGGYNWAQQITAGTDIVPLLIE